MVKRACKSCGSIYEIEKHKIGMRDKDKIDCKVCGTKLLSWNGGVFYSAVLVERKEPT